jgi:hypothetical protein
MSIHRHRKLLFGLIHGLGMLVGLLGSGAGCLLALWLLPALIANAGSPGVAVLFLIVLAGVTTCAWGGGVWAVRLAERWFPTRCPTCGRPSVRARFMTATRFVYECTRCGRFWSPDAWEETARTKSTG